VSELETAVVIVLDDARPQLEPVRAEFHAGEVAMGIPLHVTLLYPFAPGSLFPLTCHIRDVALLEEYEPDRWRERRRFPLRA
jgi:hypothetical protein